MDRPTHPDDFSRASVGWLVQRLSARYERAMEEALVPVGLALGEFALLMRVIGTDGQTQSDLGAVFAMAPWKVSRCLDRLQGAGLIERRQDPCSRRTHRIHATDRGRALLPCLQAVARGVNARVLAPLAPAQHEALLSLLAQVVLSDDTA